MIVAVLTIVPSIENHQFIKRAQRTYAYLTCNLVAPFSLGCEINQFFRNARFSYCKMWFIPLISISYCGSRKTHSYANKERIDRSFADAPLRMVRGWECRVQLLLGAQVMLRLQSPYKIMHPKSDFTYFRAFQFFRPKSGLQKKPFL